MSTCLFVVHSWYLLSRYMCIWISFCLDNFFPQKFECSSRMEKISLGCWGYCTNLHYLNLLPLKHIKHIFNLSRKKLWWKFLVLAHIIKALFVRGILPTYNGLKGTIWSCPLLLRFHCKYTLFVNELLIKKCIWKRPKIFSRNLLSIIQK